MNSQNNDAHATSVYKVSFTDDFNRNDTANGSVGNGWVDAGSAFRINGNAVLTTTGTDNFLLRPNTMQNGKIEFVPTQGIAQQSTQVTARYDANTTHSYIAGLTLWDGNLIPIIYKNGTENGDRLLNLPQTTYDYTTANLRVEFIVQSVSTVTTLLTMNVYNGNNLISAGTIHDSDSTLQSAGSWGIKGTGYNANYKIDEFSLYEEDTAFYLTTNTDDVYFAHGNNITYTITGSTDATISLSDNGAGGSFSPSANVVLNAGNSYSADVTYTPSQAGYVNVTGTISSDPGVVLDSTIFVSPYSTAIGFIGDSITQSGNVSNLPQSTVINLGDGFTAYNAGVGYSTTGMWANDNFDNTNGTPPVGTPIMTNALQTFSNNDVEIVHIMLGTNDALTGVSVDDYKTNLQTIVDRLKTAGIRQVILSYPLASNNNPTINTNLVALQPAIDEIVAENSDYVLLGDTEAYDYFLTNHSGNFSDTVHLNDSGIALQAQFWANAIMSDLEYQVNPDKTWSSSDNEFTLGETGTLTLSIDKYFAEFTGVVKVNGNVLTAGSDYTATAGSTVIELLNSYLNTLGAGTYTLSVQFAGGVWVDSAFTVLADGTITPTPVDPNAPAVPSGPGVPNTGLFGLDKNTTVSLFGVIAVVILGGVVFTSRKLLKSNK